MDYSIETAAPETLQYDCIIVGVYQDMQLSPSAIALNDSTRGLITAIMSRGDLSGKNGETVLINFVPDSQIERILVVGLGKKEILSQKNYRKALAAAIAGLKKTPIQSAACCLAECDVAKADLQWKTRQIVEVFNDAVYQFVHLKSDKETESKLQKVAVTASEDQRSLAEAGLAQGQAIAAAVDLTKFLADLPGNVCTPTYLAEQAVEIGKKHDKITVHVLEESDMKELGMGSLLSVSRGSRQPPKLITLEYHGGDKNSKPIVLIGKGLTFDAGGISLKPGLGMDEMKYDMCGGAAVLATVQAAAQLQLPLNVVGLVPASENLPDGNANKPGDIVTSLSGKTIEVLNTDA